DDPFAGIRGRRIEIPIREDLEMSTAWIAVDTFEELGFEARLVTDATADVSSDRIVFLGGNALWHERALNRVRALPRPHLALSVHASSSARRRLSRRPAPQVSLPPA